MFDMCIDFIIYAYCFTYEVLHIITYGITHMKYYEVLHIAFLFLRYRLVLYLMSFKEILPSFLIGRRLCFSLQRVA